MNFLHSIQLHANAWVLRGTIYRVDSILTNYQLPNGPVKKSRGDSFRMRGLCCSNTLLLLCMLQNGFLNMQCSGQGVCVNLIAFFVSVNAQAKAHAP